MSSSVHLLLVPVLVVWMGGCGRSLDAVEATEDPPSSGSPEPLAPSSIAKGQENTVEATEPADGIDPLEVVGWRELHVGIPNLWVMDGGSTKVYSVALLDAQEVRNAYISVNVIRNASEHLGGMDLSTPDKLEALNEGWTVALADDGYLASRQLQDQREELMVFRSLGSDGLLCSGRFDSPRERAYILQVCRSLRTTSSRPGMVEAAIDDLELVVRVPEGTAVHAEHSRSVRLETRGFTAYLTVFDEPQTPEGAVPLMSCKPGSEPRTEFLPDGFEVTCRTDFGETLWMHRMLGGRHIRCRGDSQDTYQLNLLRELCSSLAGSP